MTLSLTFGVGGVPAVTITFGPGSLIIPMDTGNPGVDDGQDGEMLRAYGLVHALLRDAVPVYWAIHPTKAANGNDFTIPSVGFSVRSVRDGAAVGLPRPYRGGPFIIAAADAAAALPIINSWQASAGDATEVHEVISGSFTPTDVPRMLLRAPRIAVLLDGNEHIAFNNLNAAGILDSTGGSWGNSSPDLLTEAQVVGASTSDPDDGILFQPSGLPRYCHLVAMHYVTTSLTPHVVREVRSWLGHGPLTHAFVQCAGIEVLESDPNGHFLTTAGVDDDGSAASDPINRSPSDPLSQIDGAFSADSGAVDSIGLLSGSMFRTGTQTLFNENATPLTSRITMLTGRMDGVSVPPVTGRVTYLAGHDYSVSLPVSSNPQTNGVRLMLNAIFESDCATDADPDPQDDVVLTKTAPALSTTNQIDYTITLSNPGPRPVENVTLTDVLPSGTTYVGGSGVPAPSATAGGVLIWNLPPLASGASATVTFSVSVAADGTYANTAELTFAHLTVRTVASNTATTTVDLPELVAIEVTPTSPSVAAGGSLQFTATGTFSDGSTQDLTASAAWSSSAPGVATVSNAPGSRGLATGVATGMTEIAAASSGIVSDAITLTVTDAVLVAIEVTPTNPSVAAGNSLQLTATGTFSDGSTHDVTAVVAWSSSAPAVATVSNGAGSEGLATGVAVGMTEITANFGSVSGATMLTVTEAVLVAIEVTPTNPSVPAGGSLQLTATGTLSDGSTQDLTAVAAWSSSTPSVATVSNAAASKGLATGVAVGTTEITASSGMVSGATTLAVTGAVCSSGPLDCKASGLTSLTMRNDPDDDRRDNMTFSWTRGDATTANELGDPTVDTQYTVCVWDYVGGVADLVMEMVAPAGGNCVGRPCWRAIGSGGFRYKDPGLLPHGIRRMTLKAGALGRARVSVEARGVVKPDPPMPFQQSPSITVQVVNSIGSCWGADYVSAAQVNTEQRLSAKERP
jgi:uncharacterized repeat protein (TIGR01451 family)